MPESNFEMTLKVFNTIDRLVAAGMAYKDAIAKVRAVLEAAQSENRDPTDEEWATLNAAGDAELAKLHEKTA